MSYFPITFFDQIGEARREGLEFARELGFSENQAGKVALAITEAGTNLVKHAGGGGMFLGPAPENQLEHPAPVPGHPARGGRGAGTTVGPPDRRAPRLRQRGADPHCHRSLRDCPERLQLRRGRPGGVLRGGQFPPPRCS